MSTQRDLIVAVREALGKDATWRMTREIVDKVIAVMGDCILRDGTLQLDGFGAFEVRRRPAMRRGSFAGGTRIAPAVNIITFRPFPAYKARVWAWEPPPPPAPGDGAGAGNDQAHPPA